ncbi:WecB/TagA/CpsF family glycosyltransferase, partial [Candidatus Gracilibacteria bacterium]|nr:WecB/TagA/CpsF family glycosyltransferase [Candidatus Gracilibacteria bacterium]
SLLGISFYKGTYQQCLDGIRGDINNNTSQLVVTPNPEMLYDASHDSELLEVLKNAPLALPDGAGIFVAYQIAESRLPSFLKYIAFPLWCLRAVIHNASFVKKYGERITGSRLTRDLIVYAAEMKIPVTIIDPVVNDDSAGDRAKKASQETMKKSLEEKFPGLVCQVIISDSISEISKSPNLQIPDHGIIFATHGNGKQEKLLSEVVKKYPQCGLCMGIGGSIDLITGFRQPAPAFFQRFGGEWLYRLYKNPSRHWKRMKKVMSFLLGQITV